MKNVIIVLKDGTKYPYHDVEVDFYKEQKNLKNYLLVKFTRENGYQAYYHFPIELIDYLEFKTND